MNLTQIVSTVKPLADASQVSDSQIIQTYKKRSDSAILQDDSTTAFNKNPFDNIGITLSKNISTVKPLADSPEIVDITAKGIQKPLFDSSQVSDSQTVQLEKQLSYSVFGTDDIDGSSSIADEHTFLYVKTLTNSTGFTDSVVFASQKPFQLTQLVEDSGAAKCQSYCDPSYFAEGYVGQYQTF